MNEYNKLSVTQKVFYILQNFIIPPLPFSIKNLLCNKPPPLPSRVLEINKVPADL